MAAVLRFYQQSFDARPYVTLCVTNGVLNSVGDGVAQIATQLVDRRKATSSPKPLTYDVQRTARFFAFGFGLGPFIGRWNLFLEKHFPLRAAATAAGGRLAPGKQAPVSLAALAKRVGSDQVIMAPLGLTVFIGSMGLMEGRGVGQIKQKYQDMFMPALIANWQVWPLAQLVNFRFMPLPYRVPFQSTCGIFWTLYLSILNSKEDQFRDKQREFEGVKSIATKATSTPQWMS